MALGALVLAPSGAAGQTDPRLADAMRAAQEGQGDSARASVQRLLAATPPTDTLYPQILYTQAMVAGTAGERRRLLQQVTVEHATSSWADDALLRLVQMDYATRNYDGAARNLERLRLDFPATELLPQASYWAARTYFDANNPAAACRWLADGMARARNDLELQNQLGYLYQRCDLRADSGVAQATDTAVADGARAGRAPPSAPTSPSPPAGPPTAQAPGASGSDSSSRPGQTPAPTPPTVPATASPPSAAAPAPAPPRAARTIYRVQIAAVASRKAADEAARKARPLGLTVVTVEEKGLYKVRLGEYATREAAQNAAASLKAKLGGSPFVVAEP
jgi:cell division septation protein DedD